MVENVPGLANDKQFSVFRKRMEEAGYLGDQDVFNAAGTGAALAALRAEMRGSVASLSAVSGPSDNSR